MSGMHQRARVRTTTQMHTIAKLVRVAARSSPLEIFLVADYRRLGLLEPLLLVVSVSTAVIGQGCGIVLATLTRLLHDSVREQRHSIVLASISYFLSLITSLRRRITPLHTEQELDASDAIP